MPPRVATMSDPAEHQKYVEQSHGTLVGHLRGAHGQPSRAVNGKGFNDLKTQHDLLHTDSENATDTAVTEVPPEDWHSGEPTNMPAERTVLIEAPSATGDPDLDATIIQRFADLLPDLVVQIDDPSAPTYHPGGMQWVFNPIKETT